MRKLIAALATAAVIATVAPATVASAQVEERRVYKGRFQFWDDCSRTGNAYIATGPADDFDCVDYALGGYDLWLIYY